MRRALVALLLLSIVAAAAWTILRWNDGATSDADSWRAIPTQAAVIIEVPNAWKSWDRFAHTSLLWSGWEKQPATLTLSKLMSKSAQAMEGRRVARCAQRLNLTGRIGPQWIQGRRFRGSGAVHGTPPDDALGDLLGVPASERTKLSTGQVTTAQFDPGLPSLAFALRQGLWILSDSPELVEEALLQEDGGAPITADRVDHCG